MYMDDPHTVLGPKYMFYLLDCESMAAWGWEDTKLILCESPWRFNVVIRVEPGTPQPAWYANGEYVYETDEDYMGCEEVYAQLQTQSRYRQRKMRKEYREAMERLMSWGF